MSAKPVVNNQEESIEKIIEQIKQACNRDFRNKDNKPDALIGIAVFKKYFNPQNPILDINKALPDQGKWNPLALTVFLQKTEEVKALLNLGADPKLKLEKGITPLHMAATNGKASICIYLMEKGAHPDDQNDDGKTPLMRACEGGHLDVIKVFLEKNPNVMHKDRNNKTCLDYAMENTHYNVVRYIQYYYLQNNVPLKGGNNGKKATKI